MWHADSGWPTRAEGVNLEGQPVLFMTHWVIAELQRIALTIGREQEACGLLAGALIDQLWRHATVVVPLRNLSNLDGSFAISVDEIVRTQAVIGSDGLQPVALFHSHTNGSTRPSHRDARLPWVTSIPSLIVAQRSGNVRMCSFDAIGGVLTELAVVARSSVRLSDQQREIDPTSFQIREGADLLLPSDPISQHPDIRCPGKEHLGE